ncbi:hypothetical protein [Labedella endophytica]|uniref:Uncharacterized protein n=1 Tax=Labedella endophytica TaxID=1523160 RepID=A0A3S0XJT9_9MICO|nr:hypothetical protein [Labedella endophytica]RUQ97176.1 hypothetical protein ELQ94_16645 [Labedella endophytica]
MTTPAEEQPLSRRQLRELQKSGRSSSTATRNEPAATDPSASTGPVETESVETQASTSEPYAKVAPTDEVIETAEIVSAPPESESENAEPAAPPETTTAQEATEVSAPAEAVVPVIPNDGVPLTRRQARELERARTASITVIGADQGIARGETGEVVTAEAIDDPTGEHAPVSASTPELAVVAKNASETGDLTEAVIDADDRRAATGTDSASDTDDAIDTVVAGDFGEAALENDSDPLADEKPFDALIATGIAEADQTPTTSSTLIVGSPMSTFTGPIGGTGEIMVTGSIDLPRTLTGTADPGTGDRADYDRSLDHEPPAPPTAGTPVSASRAVSTHTSARDIIAPPARSKRPSIVPVLAIIAGVLMVAVLAVVVTSLLTGTL